MVANLAISSLGMRRIRSACALSQGDAEAIIEAVAMLDGDCLGEATRGDCEVVEEADVAEQD
jgi:hypothetical protein